MDYFTKYQKERQVLERKKIDDYLKIILLCKSNNFDINEILLKIKQNRNLLTSDCMNTKSRLNIAFILSNFIEKSNNVDAKVKPTLNQSVLQDPSTKEPLKTSN